MNRFIQRAARLFGLFLLLCGPIFLSKFDCHALYGDKIVVVANRSAADSLLLANYYMRKRGIPSQNLVEIAVTDKEHCSREEYVSSIAQPIRKYLAEKDPMRIHFQGILTMYGVPLMISDTGMGLKEQARLVKLRGEATVLRLRLEKIEPADMEKRQSLKTELDQIENQIALVSTQENSAAVDSEIALVREKEYPLAGWVPNPLCLGYLGKKPADMPAGALIVSRLDAPSPAIVRRMIDDSLKAEEKGLQGKKAYFDARWPDPGDKELSGYAFYDRSIHRAADLARKSGRVAVVLNEEEGLFQPGQCPDAALYCGWYSLGKYVDAFTWVPGAVGYHIASAECTTLKKVDSKVWCKVMLEKGVAATIGPVGEPYVQAFPPPDVFFKLLLDGRLTLAEAFALSSPFLSWKIILIGDPLYRPFKSALVP